MRGSRARNLQQAASVVFALIAILPLLIFAWTIYRIDAFHEFETQLGLGLALTISLLGFYVFRRMMAQLSQFVAVLTKAGAQTDVRGVMPVAPVPAGGVGATATPAAPAPPGARPAAPKSPATRRPAVIVPAIGAVREFADLANMMARLWKREAELHLGREVAVSFSGATQTITGTIVEVTEDGVLVERDGLQVPVSYRRIAGIEVATRS